MSTHTETISYILQTLNEQQSEGVSIFMARAMFGEYALYCEGKVVALICNDLLYVKITPVSAQLKGDCLEDSPYDGAKLHYVVEEEQVRLIENLAEILVVLSDTLPKPKPKKKFKKMSVK